MDSTSCHAVPGDSNAHANTVVLPYGRTMSGELITTAQAAEMPGVQPATIYSYVARGVLTRATATSRHEGSLFRRSDEGVHCLQREPLGPRLLYGRSPPTRAYRTAHVEGPARFYAEPMRIEHVGFDPDLVDYQHAWDLQKQVHAQVVDGTREDTVLLLEHARVYTAGKRTEPHERPFDGTPVIDVDRGGKITWHGPGQLVGYPIVRLDDPIDVVAYVRRLEQMMIDVCGDLGLDAGRVEGRSGVWFPASDGRPERKVGAIGIRVSRDVTMHGFALNCDCDLSWSTTIVPCGIPDAGVTNLTRELGRDLTVAEVLPYVEKRLDSILG